MDYSGLVFDFDGTMCRLFKNYSLWHVVDELHTKTAKYGYNFPLDKDAFDIFGFIGALNDLNESRKAKLYEEMNDVLVAAEMDAVKSCELVCGVDEVLPTLKKSGYKVGVATNNSPECVLEFLRLYCNELDVPIVGRIGSRPELMKPNQWSLIETAKRLNCDINNVLFFGDTQRDYDCALNAGCRFVGVAPTFKKIQGLQLIKPVVKIVKDFYELNNMI